MDLVNQHLVVARIAHVEAVLIEHLNLHIRTPLAPRLNMGDPRDYQVLVDQMLRFLGLEQGTVAEVENSERGRRQ